MSPRPLAILAAVLVASASAATPEPVSIEFAPQGSLFAVGWSDGRAEVRDAATGAVTFSFLDPGLPDREQPIAVLQRNATRLGVGFRSGRLVLVEVPSGKVVNRTELGTPIRDLAADVGDRAEFWAATAKGKCSWYEPLPGPNPRLTSPWQAPTCNDVRVPARSRKADKDGFLGWTSYVGAATSLGDLGHHPEAELWATRRGDRWVVEGDYPFGIEQVGADAKQTVLQGPGRSSDLISHIKGKRYPAFTMWRGFFLHEPSPADLAALKAFDAARDWHMVATGYRAGVVAAVADLRTPGIHVAPLRDAGVLAAGPPAIELDRLERVSSLAVSHDGRFLVAGLRRAGLRIVPLASGRVAGEARASAVPASASPAFADLDPKVFTVDGDFLGLGLKHLQGGLRRRPDGGYAVSLEANGRPLPPELGGTSVVSPPGAEMVALEGELGSYRGQVDDARRPHGLGVHWGKGPDGNMHAYAGQWQAGSKHGPGIELVTTIPAAPVATRKGELRLGRFDGDLVQGRVVKTWDVTDYTSYQGDLAEGLPHGKGEMERADARGGYVLRGTFTRGALTAGDMLRGFHSLKPGDFVRMPSGHVVQVVRHTHTSDNSPHIQTSRWGLGIPYFWSEPNKLHVVVEPTPAEYAAVQADLKESKAQQSAVYAQFQAEQAARYQAEEEARRKAQAAWAAQAPASSASGWSGFGSGGPSSSYERRSAEVQALSAYSRQLDIKLMDAVGIRPVTRSSLYH